MENRRAIYDKRYKVKNNRDPAKPDKKEKDRREKARKDLGQRLEPTTELVPTDPDPSITVVTEQCVFCGRPFVAPSVICPTCNSCQYCGGFNDDKYSNVCFICGNSVDAPRIDEAVPEIGAT